MYIVNYRRKNKAQAYRRGSSASAWNCTSFRTQAEAEREAAQLESEGWQTEIIRRD